MTTMLLMAIPARAEGNLLRVAFNELPPWKVIQADGTPGGMDIELLRMLAEKTGCRLKFVDLPFKRGLKMLEHGEVDIMVGVHRRPEREVYLHFLQPAYKNESSKAFFVLKGREHIIKKYEDLRKMKVGTGLGVRYFPRFDQDTHIQKYPLNTGEQHIKMLLAERIDTFIMTESTGEYRIAQFGVGHAITKADFAHNEEQEVHMVLSKKSPMAHRLNEFNRALAELVDSNAMQTIKERFYLELQHD